jgi:hypothetical protein
MEVTMKDLAKDKIKYILLRYQVDSKDLKPSFRLELLKRWIDSCAEFEEYEMASALKRVRNDLVRSMRLAKVGHKHPVDRLFIKIKWVMRRFFQ